MVIELAVINYWILRTFPLPATYSERTLPHKKKQYFRPFGKLLDKVGCTAVSMTPL
jgi:hypothetical protein